MFDKSVTPIPASIWKRISTFDHEFRPFHVIELRLVPFEKWPERALRPWWWTGTTRNAHIDRGIYCRPRATIQYKGRQVSPARVLYEFLTGVELADDVRLYSKLAGARGLTQDDVNPAHYRLVKMGGHSTADDDDDADHASRPRPIKDLIMLFSSFDFWPNSVEELIKRFPTVGTDYPMERLRATVEAVR